MIEPQTFLDSLFSLLNMMIIPANINIPTISQAVENLNAGKHASELLVALTTIKTILKGLSA